MVKAFWRFLSDVCSVIGAHRLALRFLVMSLDEMPKETPIVVMENVPPGTVPEGPFDLKVVYEDKERLAELGDLRTNDVKIAKHVYDIN